MDGFAGRAFKLIDLLQGQGHQSTAQLAAHLAVSERTIRRDLVRLQRLDIPVEVTPGRHGGVSLQPGALLPPLRFTDDELLALVLGVKYLQTLGDHTLKQASSRALKRLDNVLTGETQARVGALSEALTVNPPKQPASLPAEREFLLELAQAIRDQRRAALHYTPRDKPAQTRQVDPYGLVWLGHWYLVGHCHLRQDLRTFRLDRIRRVQLRPEGFERPDGFDAFKVVAASIAQAPAHGDIVGQVQLQASLADASRWVPATTVVLEPNTAGVLLQVRVRHEDLTALALHLLALPCEFTVLAPTALRSALKRVSERALQSAAAPGDA